ncbi:MAG: hypothetical protein WHX93_06875 [bacterium]
MEVQQDFRDLLALLNAHNVEYMIIGAYALAYHGAPRYTGDLDLFVRPDLDNAQRILKALQQFGFASVGLKVQDFTEADRIVQLGVPPVRVDILTSITGVAWEEAASGWVEGMFGDVPVHYIGRKELIRNKRAIGRKKDLADLEAIGEE